LSDLLHEKCICTRNLLGLYISSEALLRQGATNILITDSNRFLSIIKEEIYYLKKLSNARIISKIINIGALPEKIIEDLKSFLNTNIVKILSVSDLETAIKTLLLEDDDQITLVIISDQYFDATLEDAKRLWIDPSLCTKCDECLKVTKCVAIGKLADNSLIIDFPMCKKCGICIRLCSNDAILIK